MDTIKYIYGAALCLLCLPALATQTLTCVSENNAFVRCGLSHADQRDIRIKSVKSGDCDVKNAWGVDSTGIWVDKGCGAVFEYTQVASSDYSGTNNNGETDIYISPGFIGPYYGPGFYYGAGYYESNGWNNHNNYDHNHDYNHDHDHHDEDHHDDGAHGGGFHGGGHGGGGRR